MELESIQPYALKSGEGSAYSFGPKFPTFMVKAGERGAGRRIAFAELITRSGEEPPSHVHGTEDEIFYVVRGAITFRCGDHVFELDDGGFVFLPRGIQHGYTIRSAGEAHLLVITSPADEEAKGGWGGLIGSLEAGAHGVAT